METNTSPKWMIWTGWGLSGLLSAPMILGGVMNLTKPAFAVEGLTKMGYPESVMLPLGVIVLISTLLYLVPQTGVLGAILLTGYLGGAVATHVRAGDGLVEILIPAIFGAVIWLGLVLRDERVRSVLPFRR